MDINGTSCFNGLIAKGPVEIVVGCRLFGPPLATGKKFLYCLNTRVVELKAATVRKQETVGLRTRRKTVVKQKSKAKIRVKIPQTKKKKLERRIFFPFFSF